MSYKAAVGGGRSLFDELRAAPSREAAAAAVARRTAQVAELDAVRAIAQALATDKTITETGC